MSTTISMHRHTSWEELMTSDQGVPDRRATEEYIAEVCDPIFQSVVTRRLIPVVALLAYLFGWLINGELLAIMVAAEQPIWWAIPIYVMVGPYLLVAIWALNRHRKKKARQHQGRSEASGKQGMREYFGQPVWLFIHVPMSLLYTICAAAACTSWGLHPLLSWTIGALFLFGIALKPLINIAMGRTELLRQMMDHRTPKDTPEI